MSDEIIFFQFINIVGVVSVYIVFQIPAQKLIAGVPIGRLWWPVLFIDKTSRGAIRDNTVAIMLIEDIQN
jgi:hypothetical protein